MVDSLGVGRYCMEETAVAKATWKLKRILSSLVRERMGRRLAGLLEGRDMPLVVGFASQKGGVGKSTLAELLADHVARQGASVVLIDLDDEQFTSVKWGADRKKHGIKPDITVLAGKRHDNWLAMAGDSDVLVLDLPGRATAITKRAAEICNLVIIPTGGSKRDTDEALVVAAELEAADVPRHCIAFALVKMNSEGQEAETRAGLTAAGYAVVKGALRTFVTYEKVMDSGYSALAAGSASLEKAAKAIAAGMLEAAGAAIHGGAEPKGQTQYRESNAKVVQFGKPNK